MSVALTHTTNSSGSKHSKSHKNEIYQKLKYLKEVSNVKSQLDTNNELNRNAMNILDNLKPLHKAPLVVTSVAASQDTRKRENAPISQATSVSKKRLLDTLNLNRNISKINSELISYVRLRQNHMQHDNYWKQSWLFTDNPIYEFGNKNEFTQNRTSSVLNFYLVLSLDFFVMFYLENK